MGRYRIDYADFDDTDEYDEIEDGGRRANKKPMKFKMKNAKNDKRFSDKKAKLKPNKRTMKNLEFHTEKESETNTSIINGMLQKISAEESIPAASNSVPNDLPKYEETNKTSQTANLTNNDPEPRREEHKKVAKRQKAEHADVSKVFSPDMSVAETCQALGLKFVTANAMVLRLFTSPLSIPAGAVFYIKDAYINCDCELVQVLNKNRLMYVFKQLVSGNITTYTNVSLKDAAEIHFVGYNGKSQ